MRAETPAARRARADRATSVELALAHRPVHRRVMRQVAPVMTRVTAIEQNRERLAALGTMAAGLAHELNNPAAAARRAAGELVDALDVVGATLGHVRRGRHRARARPSGWWRSSGRRWRGRAGAHGARRARRRRRRGRAARPPRGAGRRRAVAAGRAAGAAGVDAAWLDAVADAGGAGDGGGGALGRGDADGARPRLRAAGPPRAHERAGGRGQGLRLHGPRRARRGRRARGPGDDADRPRPQAQAHARSRSSATTTARCRA